MTAVAVPFLELSRQIESIRGDVDAALRRVFDSGQLVLGPEVVRFEASFAAYCGTRHCVGVASGTDAIEIALRAAGVEPGDEVVTAANTCVPTVAGIRSAGAVPVLADVDEATQTVSAESLERVVTPRTRAIVPVHLYGQCAAMDRMLGLARDRGLMVVEDCAQAHGAELEGQRAGTFGVAAAFSFYPTKNLGAVGDAGAVVTSDDGVAERARLLRSYGERERYDSVVEGGNSRLDALQAAVLSEKLARLERWNERRREIAARYVEAFRGLDLRLPLEGDGRRHVYHLFVVGSRDRDRLRARLAGEGVQTLVHYPRAIHQHPAYASLDPGDGRLAVSERAARENLSLPLYPELADDEAELVVDAVRRACR